MVKGSFLSKMGRAPTYWLAIICAFIAAMVVDIAIITLRVTFFPKDADVFAELEKDPLIKTRFEEEAAAELQQSWNRNTKPNPEDEITALLNQPRSLEEGHGTTKSWPSGKVRTSDDTDGESSEGRDVSGLDVLERRASLTHTGFDEEIAQRFGAVIRKPFTRLPTSESG
jgi:hypothetical protein